MRLFLWGVLIVVLCYAAYSGMIAFSSWMKVNSAVDDIVSREGVEAGGGDHLHDGLTILAGRADRQELLPRADRADRVLANLVEHLPAVQQRRPVVRIDRQRALEEIEASRDHLRSVLGALGGDG